MPQKVKRENGQERERGREKKNVIKTASKITIQIWFDAKATMWKPQVKPKRMSKEIKSE